MQRFIIRLFGSGRLCMITPRRATLKVSNGEMNDIKKIVRSLE